MLAAGALAGVAAVALGSYLFQPWRAFTDVAVAEALPTAAAPATAPAAAVTAAPVTLLRGEFVGQDHDTSGTAVVLELADGSRVLRLQDLATSDGPDLKVWLTDAPATAEGAGAVDDGRFLTLGGLKGNLGDQNYELPADVDLDALRTVSIWCDRFDVSFGAAALA